MEPANIYPRNPFNGPVASGLDMERIFALLGRMGVWECPSCKQLFPTPDHRDAHCRKILGVCTDCFLNNEDIDGLIKMPACDHDTYVLYSKLLNDGNFFNHFGPHGNRNASKTPPLEYDLLSVFVPLFGEEELRSIIIEHRPHSKQVPSGGMPRAFFDPSSVRWHTDFGFVPVAHGYTAEDFPSKSDRKAWEAMRFTCWILDPDKV